MKKSSVKERLQQPTQNGAPREVTITVPQEDMPAGANDGPLHIDMHLDRAQANALRRLARGLDAKRATLDNGKRVVEKQHALKWIFEQIASRSS